MVVGWLSAIAYVTAADAINRSLVATPAEIEALNNGDGAKFAFALVFGWVLPAIIVGVSWAIYAVVLPRFSSNPALKQDAPAARPFTLDTR